VKNPIIDTSDIRIPLGMSAPYGSLNNKELQVSLRNLVDDPLIQHMAVSVHQGVRAANVWRLTDYRRDTWENACRRRSWSELTYAYYKNNGGTHAITGGGPMIAIEIILQYLEREGLEDLRHSSIPI
jgi:hypothetical protein